MTNREVIALIEEMLEVDANSLKEETQLAGIEEWDSMAVLMLMNMAHVKFGKKLIPAQVREFKTIGDAVGFLTREEA